jgi:spoIIIJ-associated protein
MSDSAGSIEVEAAGETVGEAKWLALRQLEGLAPGLDRESVTFQVLSEGERGILGVGTTPARVLARATPGSRPEPGEAGDAGECATLLREMLERITAELGVECRVEVEERDDAVAASLVGGDLGLAIGKHGRTIDAIQLVVSAVAQRRLPDESREVVVDAAGYRERRRERLAALALRSADRALESGAPVELEPMPATERKLVHQQLEEIAGVETWSEGEEPYRYVIVAPARGGD